MLVAGLIVEGFPGLLGDMVDGGPVGNHTTLRGQLSTKPASLLEGFLVSVLRNMYHILRVLRASEDCAVQVLLCRPATFLLGDSSCDVVSSPCAHCVAGCQVPGCLGSHRAACGFEKHIAKAPVGEVGNGRYHQEPERGHCRWEVGAVTAHQVYTNAKQAWTQEEREKR